MKTKGKISKLEMARGFASSYVLISHALLLGLTRHSIYITLPFRLGQEAVMCFFLLSGFVIYYSHHLHHDHSFKTYFIRRVRRIYPIYIIALLISWIAAAKAPINRFDLIGNLFFLQDLAWAKPGVWFDTFCGNLPLWSLSYEWWFYMMFFPIYTFIPPRRQLTFVSLISMVGLLTYSFRPNQLSLFLLYFILWWSGLEMARTYCEGNTPTFYTQRPSIGMLALFCILVPIVTLRFMPHPGPLSLGLHPLLEIQHFLACLLILCIALLWSAARWIGYKRLFGFFKLIAPLSYALYVFHYPFVLHHRILPSVQNSRMDLVLSIIVLIGLAYLAETYAQPAIDRLTGCWLRRCRPKFDQGFASEVGK